MGPGRQELSQKVKCELQISVTASEVLKESVEEEAEETVEA